MPGHSFPCNIERMPKAGTIVVALITVGVLLVLYKFVFNPQAMPGKGLSAVCPDRWQYLDGLCKPDYQTSCMPFNPTTITSDVQGCNLARTCGTNWPGKCA